MAGKQVQAWDIDRLASALLDVVDTLSAEQLADLAAIGRKVRAESGGGDSAKGTAA